MGARVVGGVASIAGVESVAGVGEVVEKESAVLEGVVAWEAVGSGAIVSVGWRRMVTL